MSDNKHKGQVWYNWWESSRADFGEFVVVIVDSDKREVQRRKSVLISYIGEADFEEGASFGDSVAGQNYEALNFLSRKKLKLGHIKRLFPKTRIFFERDLYHRRDVDGLREYVERRLERGD